jgi:aspartate/methionine/tyrosine aminotransferase
MIAKRLTNIRPSGVRRIFDLARKMENPINLSIGEPDFDIPEPLKQEGIEWIQKGFNKYTPTQGIPELREKVREYLRNKNVEVEEIMVTAGVSGGILLSCLALVDPGDEIIIPDPYFVMYEYVVLLMGGVPVFVDTYPDFTLREESLRKALTEKTKMIIINSPNNPTGNVYSPEELKMVADIAEENNLLVLSDDIYEKYLYEIEDHHRIGQIYPKTLTLGGFSKSWAMTGWRLGFVAGPGEIIQHMTTLQQYSFTCAPSFAQRAAVMALDYDVSGLIAGYRRKRDLVYEGLREKYTVQKPKGAFYIFPEAKGGDSWEFVERAIENNLFIVPGNVFSKRNTHFRISYAASDDMLMKGIEILNRIA